MAGVALTVFGCSGDTPIGDIPLADTDLITVFYPIDGVVRGRGLPGTFPSSLSHVQVRAQPTGTVTLQPIDGDGGFTFSIVAVSGDLLEIAGSADDVGRALGAPIYVRVPPTPLPTVDYVCCQPVGTCQSIDDAREGGDCPDPLTGVTTCDFDVDCGVDEGEYLGIDLERINVTAPNERGRVNVNGFVEPNALVVVENRGLNGIGIPGPRFRTAQITSDIGAFVVNDVRAKGDDEIVVQVRDLNGFRSPAVPKYVPDADLRGVDVVGAFAWAPLTNGARGPIALQISPWGIDGKGLCPDTDAPPEVCYSGGLTHEMVSISRAQMRVGADLVDLRASPTATTTGRPHNRGREGDVRSGPQDVVVVIDVSATAQTKDGNGLAPPRRFEAAARFIEGLRDRDRVSVVTYAGTHDRYLVEDPRRDSGLVDLTRRAEVVQHVRNLSNAAPGADNDIFGAILAAASNLRNARTDAGRIVVIAADAPPGTPEEALLAYDAALDAVSENLSRGEPQITVDLIALQIPEGTSNLDLVTDVVTFTDGRTYQTNANGIEQTLADARSFLSGSFLLLYDIDVPAQVGKSGTIELELDVLVGANRASTTYSGPIFIQNSSNN